MKTKENTELM